MLVKSPEARSPPLHVYDPRNDVALATAAAPTNPVATIADNAATAMSAKRNLITPPLIVGHEMIAESPQYTLGPRTRLLRDSSTPGRTPDRHLNGWLHHRKAHQPFRDHSRTLAQASGPPLGDRARPRSMPRPALTIMLGNAGPIEHHVVRARDAPRPDGWTSGSLPLQPVARTRRLVGGVTTSTRPRNRSRCSE